MICFTFCSTAMLPPAIGYKLIDSSDVGSQLASVANSENKAEIFRRSGHYLLHDQETARNQRATLQRVSPDTAGQSSVGASRPGGEDPTAGEGRSHLRRRPGPTLLGGARFPASEWTRIPAAPADPGGARPSAAR